MSCPNMVVLYITSYHYTCMQGVENVYTRHKPLLSDTLDTLVKGKLKETQFPYAGDHRLADK